MATVGLTNPGCSYRNSVLQEWFSVPAIRRAIYSGAAEPGAKPMAVALARVLYQMQTSTTPVDADAITSEEQQDANQFAAVLQDDVQIKALDALTTIKCASVIQCMNIPHRSERSEDIWTPQLTVARLHDIDAAFAKWSESEALTGDNKYYVDGHGYQDAQKFMEFTCLPPVFSVALKRYEMSFETFRMVKLHHRVEFPTRLNMSKFVRGDAGVDHMYLLQSVLVHLGRADAGCNFTYARGSDGAWYCYRDDKVRQCTEQEAVEHSYGSDTTAAPVAMRLLYVRESEAEQLLRPITEDEVPEIVKGSH
eukprot:TRINITY_DN4295_c0_g4_i1.p1 TRINITY_DN4295_c0_g4~~TRINITY_DN4295_c0_g4_i1.p1  ORF type:complete len:323 (+),score=56.08 TRINITY_DN4295_c0_g4_i1:48-971(+)